MPPPLIPLAHRPAAVASTSSSPAPSSSLPLPGVSMAIQASVWLISEARLVVLASAFAFASALVVLKLSMMAHLRYIPLRVSVQGEEEGRDGRSLCREAYRLVTRLENPFPTQVRYSHQTSKPRAMMLKACYYQARNFVSALPPPVTGGQETWHVRGPYTELANNALALGLVRRPGQGFACNPPGCRGNLVE